MKNNKTFIKKWKLNGLPYLPAELRDEALKNGTRNAAYLWLTDDCQSAQRLLAQGEACLWLLTAENRNAFGGGIPWCAEVLDSEKEGWRGRLARAESEGLPDWLTEDFLWRVWLRERGLPWHICETERLVLREMTETDLDFLYKMRAEEGDGGFSERLCKDREGERQKLAAYREKMYGFYGFGIWIILEKESGAPAGLAGLQMRDGFAEPELGFAVLKKYRRKGYAEEACRAVLSYAARELELQTVRAVADAENTASRRLCEKLGFAEDETAVLDGRPCVFCSVRVQ